MHAFVSVAMSCLASVFFRDLTIYLQPTQDLGAIACQRTHLCFNSTPGVYQGLSDARQDQIATSSLTLCRNIGNMEFTHDILDHWWDHSVARVMPIVYHDRGSQAFRTIGEHWRWYDHDGTIVLGSFLNGMGIWLSFVLGWVLTFNVSGIL